MVVFTILHPGYLRVGLQSTTVILKIREHVLFIFYIPKAQETILLI